MDARIELPDINIDELSDEQLAELSDEVIEALIAREEAGRAIIASERQVIASERQALQSEIRALDTQIGTIDSERAEIKRFIEADKSQIKALNDKLAEQAVLKASIGQKIQQVDAKMDASRKEQEVQEKIIRERNQKIEANNARLALLNKEIDELDGGIVADDENLKQLRKDRGGMIDKAFSPVAVATPAKKDSPLLRSSQSSTPPSIESALSASRTPSRSNTPLCKQSVGTLSDSGLLGSDNDVDPFAYLDEHEQKSTPPKKSATPALVQQAQPIPTAVAPQASKPKVEVAALPKGLLAKFGLNSKSASQPIAPALAGNAQLKAISPAR